jgi:BirA family biotin operon repressor/biotin-[acetyl-CoA-carboxylase] ligase
LSEGEQLSDFTVVYTENQTNGKGQMGSKWQSNKSDNLTFSVFCNSSFLKLKDHFYLNCAVSISVFSVLHKLMIPQLSVKWPNDILSGHKKLSGILIENVIKSSSETHSIIGVGLNVNQLEFNPLFKATSLKAVLGQNFNLEEVLILLIAELQKQFKLLKNGQFDDLHDAYEKHLFRKNKPSTFKNAEGELFSGFIKNVTPTGELQILVEDAILKEFKLKEIKLLY